jgi:hypothetical protein
VRIVHSYRHHAITECSQQYLGESDSHLLVALTFTFTQTNNDSNRQRVRVVVAVACA